MRGLHTHEAGRIERHGVLSLQDDGGGIPESILPRIFEPYFTAKELGIGICMAKMIVERNMKGQSTAANVEKGAAFTLPIPPSRRGL